MGAYSSRNYGVQMSLNIKRIVAVCIHQIPASSMTERAWSARLIDFELIPAHDTPDAPITLLL
jgi:hypothetical protein